MNEQAIQDGYKYFKETGYKGSLEDYIKLMSTNPNAVKDTYTYFQKTGYNGSEEDFSVLFGLDSSVKKKDQPQPQPQPQPVPVDSDGSGGQEITEDVLTEEEGIGSSEYLQDQNLDFQQAEVKPYSPIGSNSQMEDLSVGEKSTAIERTFGKNEFTDFFGDMWRAGVQGQAQGGTIDESLEILGKSRVGAEITSEDIQDFLVAQRKLQSVGVSDEMKDFNRIYAENGGGAWGWVKGVAANPSTIGQLFVSSMSAMVNPAVLAGAATGAAVGSAIGPLGTAGGFFAGASVTLETGLTFAELLQKEVLDKGYSFNEEGVRKVLEDKTTMSSIRNKSAARGLVIGAIDGIASKVGIKVGARTLGGKAYGVGKKLKAGLQVAGIEAVGGSLGEVGGRVAASQEMDAAEILFEGVAGTATLPGTLGIAAYKSPKYYINKSKFDESSKDLTRVDPDVMEEMVYNSTDAEFAAAEVTIKNNPELQKIAEERKNKIHSKSVAQKEILDVNKDISQEKLDKLIPLQQELNTLEGNKSQPAKERRAEIIAKMKEINEAKETEKKEDAKTVEPKLGDKKASPEVKQESKDLAEEIDAETETEVENTSEEQTEVIEEVVEDTPVVEEVVKGDEVKTNQPVSIKYNRNKEKSPDMGSEFGQDVEASGVYVTQDNGFTPDGFESGTADIKSPLVIEVTDDTQIEYKRELSKKYKGKKGKALTKALIKDGYDSIITKNEDGTTGEIIILDDSIINKTEIKQDANTEQSTTTIPGQEQTTVTPTMDEGNAKSEVPSRKSDSNTKTEQQKTDTQKKAKVKELKAIAPNAYVNESDSGSRKRSEKFIKPTKRALAALKRLAPKVMVVIHETEADYQNATGNNKVRSAGLFNPKTNIIHINADLANVRVLQHEVFHAILKNKLGSESKIAALSDRMMKALAKADLSPEVKKQIDNYVNLYKEYNKGDKARLAFANEEYMAEVFSFLANNMASLKAPEKTIVQKFLSKLSNLLGLTAEDIIATDKDMIDLINVIAGKVQTGETITKSDVKQLDLFAGGKNVKNPSAALKTQIVGGFEVTYTENEKIAEYIKDGRITEPENLESFRRNNTAITSPDDMVVGEISFEGEKIFEGQGGLFFVTKFKDVWAAGDKATATKLANMINKSVDANGGKGYLTLTKGTDKKLISSAAGVNSSLGIIDVLLSKNILPKAVIRTAVNKVIKDFGGGNINLTGSSKQMISQLRKFFGNKKNATFNDRGTVMERIITEIGMDKRLGDLKKKDSKLTKILGGDPSKTLVGGKTSKTANSLVDLLASLAAEDITKGLNTGDIYAVIEVDGKVEYYPGDHPSYPAHIRQVNGNPPILHLPKNRPPAKDYLMRDSGKIYKTPAVSPTEYGSFYEKVDSKSEVKTSVFVLFDKSDTINDVVAKARGRDYSDAAIYEYLRNNRKLTVDAARAALEQKTGEFTGMPFEFTRVEDNKGQTLFNEITYEIKKWMRKNPNATPIQIAKESLKILRDNDIFKAQYKTVKAEVEVSYASFLNNIKSQVIKKRIARLKRDLYLRKQGEIDLRKVQIQLKQLIEKYLPSEATFSKSEVKNLLTLVANSNSNSILSVGQKVLKIVDQKRKQVKNNIIFDMKKILNKALKETGSRPKATSVEAQGKEFFKDVIDVIRAVTLPNTIAKGETASKRTVALSKLENQIKANEEATNIALEKQKRNERLTVAEVRLINRVLAFDTYANIQNLELEAVKDLYNLMKLQKAASIAMLNASRLERAEINNDIYNQATSEIRENHPELFDKITGEPLDSEKIEQIRSQMFQGTLKNKIINWWNQYKFTSGIGIANFFRNQMSHLGTLMNLIDNVAKKNTFFYDNVYQAMNRMHTKALRGYYNQQEILNSIAATIPGIESFKDWKSKIPFGIRTIVLTDGKKYQYNIGQLIRIYALAKNSVQEKKLVNNGFGPKQLLQIEEFIGTDAIEFADKIVEYLSTDYFESINDVYLQNNYVNLNPVENYFPTKSISAANQQELQGGNFSQVFNQENNSATKNRSDVTGKVDTKETFTDTLENHISQMERYKAYAPGVKNLEAIFKVPAVNTLLTELGIKKTIYNSINLALNPQAGMVNRTIIDKLMTKFTGFALSFKAVQLLKQSTSFVNAFEEYDGNIGQFMLGMAKVIARLPYYIRLAKTISPDFTDRLRKGLEGDIYRLESGSRIMKPIEKRLTGSDVEGRINRAVTFFKKAAASPTVMGDVMGVMGYMVNYERNLSKGMSKAKAAEAFNNYNATQQSRRDTDKIPLQQSQSAFVRPFTMFGSTLFLQINKVLQAQSNIMKSIGEKGRLKNVRSKDIRALVLNYAGANVMFALAANVALLMKGDDEDKEVAMNRMKDAMYGLNLLYQIPLFGSAAEEGINKIKGRKGYSDDVVNPFKTISRKIFKATKDKSLSKGIIPLVEIGLGTQLDPFVGLYNIFGTVGKKQDEAIYNVLGISPSYQPALNKSYSREDLKYIKETNPEFYDQLQRNKKVSTKTKNKQLMRTENPELYYQLYGTY